MINNFAPNLFQLAAQYQSEPPVASFTYSPLEPQVTDKIIFDASASIDPDGSIVSYLWDFGHGDTSTENKSVTTHTYDQEGSYIVTLTVTENSGLTDTTTASIGATDNNLLIMASGSMEPTIKIGDYVRIDRQITIDDIYAAPKNANPPGNIIVYQRPTGLIVHRAIEKINNPDGSYSFITQGDANAAPDPIEVDGSRFVGKIIESISSSEK